MVSVVEQARARGASTSSVGVALVGTPVAGDVLYVAIVSDRTPPRTVTGVSGCGATWTRVHTSASTRLVVYKGVGATTSGTVTVTLNSTQNTGVGLWSLRGLSDQRVWAALATGVGTSLTSPSRSVVSGQVALALAIGPNELTWPTSQNPSASWTTVGDSVGSGFRNVIGYAVPGSTANHNITVGIAASSTLYSALIVVGYAPPSDYESEVLADSPLGYWRLGESNGTAEMYDSSGNARDGLYLTNTSTASTNTAVTGLITGDQDGASAFNGALVHGRVVDAAWMDATSATFEAWFTTTSTSAGLICARWPSSGTTNAYMYVTLSTSDLVEVHAFIAGATRTAQATVTGLRDGLPHHVVGTYDGSDLILYVDGAEVARVTISGSLPAVAANFEIARRGGAAGIIVGTLDEVAYYGTALSAARVLAHYNTGLAIAGEEIVAIGRATETDTGRSVTASPVAVPVGRATETDTGRSVTPVTPVVVTIGRALETDTGRSVTPVTPVAVAVGRATETNTGGVITPTEHVAIGRASETDTATSLSLTVYPVIGRAIETDVAGSLTSVATDYVAIGRAVETDTASPITASPIVVPLGRAVETDTADTVIAPAVDVAAIGRATEADTASAVTPFAAGGFAIDLSSFVNLDEGSTSWDGTRLHAVDGIRAYFTFYLAVDPATTYTVEVDYEQTLPLDGGGNYSIHTLAEPSENGYNTSPYYGFLGGDGGYTGEFGTEPILPPSGTSTITIGPGIYEWDDAVVGAGEVYLVFSTGRLDITAIRVSPALIVSGEPEPPGTDVTNRSGGRTRSGYGIASWSPNVVAPPEGVLLPQNRISAQAFGPVTIQGTQAVYAVSETELSRARQQIIIGGKDITFWRDVPTPDVEFGLVEPLLYGPASLYLPQVVGAFEEPGEGDLLWLVEGKTVVVRLVLDGTIIGEIYRGVVIAFEPSDPGLNVEFGGELQGRAVLRDKQPPIFRDVLDLGRLAWRAVKDLGLAFQPRIGPETGIKSLTWGGGTHLDYILELCAKAQHRNGDQWTIMPDAQRVYRMTLKDRTTVDYTIFTDDTRTIASLRRDAAEKPNRIFATGVTPAGQRVRFGAYPGLKQSPVPDYPMAGGVPFGIGTTNDDTVSGDGISVMVNRLWVTGFLSLADYPGGYDDDIADAVAALQDRARVTGAVGVMTTVLWDILWDVSTSYTLRGAEILPASQDPAADPHIRSASGAIIGKNLDHDAKLLIVDRTIDVGSGFRRGQIQRFAEGERLKGGGRYGTVTITMGAVLIGDVAIGATVTPEMVRDARFVRPGDNVRLPMKGNIIAHVVSADVSGTTVVLTIDTAARDALKVWEGIERNRETRRSAARLFRGNRASTETKDAIEPWDEVGGSLDGDVPLDIGWTVVPVVAGQEGTMADVSLAVQATTTEDEVISIDGREYACMVFGREVSAGRLNALQPAPLTEAGTERWENAAFKKAMKKHGLLFAAGTFEEPCGYSPGKKTRGATLTGLFEDEAGFGYKADPRPVVYLAIWTGASGAHLRGGRGDQVMKNRLEAGA